MEFDFIENASIEEAVLQSVVPEPYRSLYVKGDDGRYIVDPKVKMLAESYTGVNKKLAGVMKDKGNFSKEAADRRGALKAITDVLTEMGIDPGDDIPGALKSKITELVESTKSGKDMTAQLEKIKLEHQRKLDEAIGVKNAELLKMTGSLERHLIERTAATALAESKVVKNGVDFLMPHVKSQTRVVTDDNGEYTVRVVDTQGDIRSDGKGGWMGVPELVNELKSTFPMAFESQAPAGSGSKPGAASKGPVGRSPAEMSSTEKIAAGLNKRVA